MLKKILDAFANPSRANTWVKDGAIWVVRLGVFREWHALDSEGKRYEHDHTAVLGATAFRFQAIKRALLQRHGLASHWSITHDGYWSCIRYCAMPTPKKPALCLDGQPALWDARGVHPNIILDCCHEPVAAKATEV